MHEGTNKSNDNNGTLRIKLHDDTYLVAYASPDDYKEIVVYVEKDGIVWQDLAIVREQYEYKDNDVINKHGEYEILVYNDEYTEDYTDKFQVKEYTEESDA